MSEKDFKKQKNAVGKGFEHLEGDKEVKVDTKFVQVEKYLKTIYDFRYNEVSNEVEYKPKDEATYTACNENNIYRKLQHEGISFSVNNLCALLRSDFVPVYNPFEDYFNRLDEYNPADEEDHITKLCTYIHAKDQERFNNQFKKMLVRSLVCCLVPGVFNKQAFILVHNSQNSGKSTFCRWLCPPELNSYFIENLNSDKDGQIALSENFLINLDELASFTKADIYSLKSFLSKDYVKVRRPFEKKASTVPRRASFVGSTNDSEFLTDNTGSVRWLCFEIEKINWNYKTDIDINRVWAQAYHLYKVGYKYQMDERDISENEKANETFNLSSMEMQLIQKHFQKGDTNSHFYSSVDILHYLSQKYTFSNKMTLKSIGSALVKLGYSKVKVGHTPNTQRYGYYLEEIQNINITPSVSTGIRVDTGDVVDDLPF